MHPRILLILSSLLVPAIHAAEERFRFERPVMGTRFVVVCYADDRATATRAANTAFEIAEEVNSVTSDYLPTSELSLLSSKPPDKPVLVSSLLYPLLEHSRTIAAATNGAFDPSLGSVTRLWRETRDHRRLPAPENLETARSSTGWKHFSLDPTSRSITLHRPGMTFDLGGVAKGYVADLMLESLTGHGIRRAMIAAGGDIRLGDPPPGREGWRVALQTFEDDRFDEVITLSNAAVSTSGDLNQWVEIDGVRYSHIISPVTGLGLTQRIAAVVIADKGKISDPLATAACVLGPGGSGKIRLLPGVRELKFRTAPDFPPHHP